MNLVVTPSAARSAPVPQALLDRVCSRIAPTFPLDSFIAVSPYWGFVQEPIEVAAKRLSRLSGTKLVMPRAWYRERFRRGELTASHLQMALDRAGSSVSLAALERHLEQDDTEARRILLMTHLADAERDLGHRMSFGTFVTHSVSQLCAAYFDQGQALWSGSKNGGLYEAWQNHARADHSVGLLMDCPELRQLAAELPRSHRPLIDQALHELGVSAEVAESYLSALLLDINGWAAWCAYRRFQARLRGADDHALEELLAVRLAWELLLYRSGGGGRRDRLERAWAAARLDLPSAERTPSLDRQEELDWLLQRAAELGFQEQLSSGLKQGAAPTPQPSPTAQLVFCIDVRSEPFRRALERANPTLQTLGFAGFFGLPLEYAPLGTELLRAQLPGLLAARLRASDAATSREAEARIAGKRRARLGASQGWLGFQRGSTSSFAFVEALGLTYAAKLARDAFGWRRQSRLDDVGLSHHELCQLKPRLSSTTNGAEVELAERIELVANILKAAGLTQNLARLVVFAGHTSDSVNNPHAAGLDCGACSGQSGAVNARVLAALSNDPRVREGLAHRGLVVPATTHFIGAVHRTTTDEFELFELDEVPETHGKDLAELERALAEAGRRARAERASSLGLAGDDQALLQSVRQRARDWSEVRPEWGLVDNAAFIVAPRSRTKSLDLKGRAFLHEYRSQDDPGFSVLELIMTAPMVVTHWINMQYFASTVDNERYGSGNKALHNVVGGHLGVFEGNGGDLRIGLPLQSIHDGERFRHTPVRLSVYIEAPRAAIDDVIARHALVRQLVENQWLHLFQIEGNEVAERRRNDWVSV